MGSGRPVTRTIAGPRVARKKEGNSNYEWEYHLCTDEGSLLLGGLHSLVAKLLRVDAQRIRDASTKAHGLNQERNQAADIIEPGAVGEILQSLRALDARSHFRIDQRKFRTELRMTHDEIIRDSLQRWRKTQTGLHTHDQQI
jgi:hypothetical protein